MSQPIRYYAALCQVDQKNPQNRSEMRRNTASMLRLMEQAVVGYRPFHDIKLVVFPEFAHAAPVYGEVHELLEHLALPADNEEIALIAAKAKELSVFVQTGSFLEVDPQWPDVVFNTTLLINADGQVISRYRKVNPWIPWEVHASPHDLPDYPDDPLPVVDTELGHLAVATCYDWLFPEVTRTLALKGAEVLIRISAYMDPWGTTEPMNWWTLVNRTRAIENTAYVLGCNQGASGSHYPPFSWPGGSMAVDYDGRILAEATPGAGEKIVVAPVDLSSLRSERRRRMGHDMRAHHRAELYGVLARPQFPAETGPSARTIETNNELIQRSKDDLEQN
ncbi:MAG: formamidase [Planctomycetota bacterium]|jgi:formamidase